MRFITSILFTRLLGALIALPANAQSTGSITGVVQDTLGAIVQGATVTVVGPDGKEKTVTVNKNGEFNCHRPASGQVHGQGLRQPKFALYEQADVEVTPVKKPS
jgi:hypothetical protein